MAELIDSQILLYLKEKNWEIVHEEVRPERQAGYVPYNDLTLGSRSLLALKSFEHGIYRHQHGAIQSFLSGANIALATPTASGKTLVFNVCALERLAADPRARILAVYPLKALATEQAERWERLVADAGISAKVGRIDGGIPTIRRRKILNESRILVMTPDVMHAWLFTSLASPIVLGFLKSLRLVVLDEAHTYTGVFGSNSAFLIRRLIHASRKLGAKPSFIASSATMENPGDHLSRLTGEKFEIIEPEADTSPQASLHIMLAAPPAGTDLLSAVSDLIAFAASKTSHQSITFVDGRKQTEHLASVVDRKANETTAADDSIAVDGFQDLQIYPYRSGYEEDDRRRIQSELASGKLKGVVSTSALEMGIDLPFLSLGIIFGMPRSATSYYQRVGRVGRRMPGTIVVVNNGSVVSESIFREPGRIKDLPLAQSALYLHNQRIQYIHAMCLARPGGEDDVICDSLGQSCKQFDSPSELPEDFVSLCRAERLGEVPPELQQMKSQAADDPNHTFPLRDLDVQFRVEMRRGPEIVRLGSLSYSQLLREAYPGAVYHYQTRPYRVVRVRKQTRLVEVRPEKRYFTSPIFLPTVILPNLSDEEVFQANTFDSLVVMECALQVGEAVTGFKERRGSNAFNVQYPLDATHGIYFDAPRFGRFSFTSGIVLTHPALNRFNVKCSAIAEIVGEAFLMSLPFERQDVSAGSDRHRATRDGVKEGERFIAVYDQTYGSLRLTSHLMNETILREVLLRALEIANNDSHFDLNLETVSALKEMYDCAQGASTPFLNGARPASSAQRFRRVIMPGSSGVNVQKDNEEFEVQGVFFSPQLNGLAYRGRHVDEARRASLSNSHHSATSVIVPLDHVVPFEGQSTIGYYDMETGEIDLRAQGSGEF